MVAGTEIGVVDLLYGLKGVIAKIDGHQHVFASAVAGLARRGIGAVHLKDQHSGAIYAI